MEIVSSDGSNFQIKPGQTREVGRSNGLDSSDRTISRRHVSFFVPPITIDEQINLQFEVIGRNPIYVSRNNEVKIYRRFERGQMRNGDMFCVSSKNPVWYALREIEKGGESVRRNDLESELADNLEGGLGFKGVEDLQQEGFDFEDIDPAKEFGFVVIGHEFDSYPKKMIRDIKNWDWCLEESRKDSDDDDDDEGKKEKGSGKRKRKKGKENDDEEEWTGESEDDKVLINKSRKAQRPKYVTRSKDRGKRAGKDTSERRSTTRKKNGDVDDEDEDVEDEDEDNETLGDFIIDDENLEEDEEIGDEDDEEEEEVIDENDEDDDE